MLVSIFSSDHSTRAELSDAEGQVLGSVECDNSSASSTADLLRQVLAPCWEARPDSKVETTVLFALPGLALPHLRAAAHSVLNAVLPAGALGWSCDALEPLLAAGLGGRPGMLIHSARGAAVAAVDRSGTFRAALSPGSPLGDEGSALGLGSRTLQWIARGQRPGMPRSQRLEAVLLERLRTPSVEQAIDGFERGLYGVSELLELAGECEQLARYPDPEAACRALVLQAGRALLGLVTEVGYPGLAPITGSGLALHQSMREILKTGLPESCWVEPQESPLAGCRILGEAARQLRPAGGVAALDADVWLRALDGSR